MKKESLQSYIMYAFILLFALGLLLFPRETAAAVKNALNICFKSVIPSLFPFMFLSKLLMCLKSTKTKQNNIMKKLFSLNSSFAQPLLIGIIGGYPIGAAMISELYKSNKCTKKEAERALAFCNNCGPAFIIGTVGGGILSSSESGIFLFFIHIISAIFTGLFLRISSPLDVNECEIHFSFKQTQTESIARKITSSVQSSINSILNISAYIVLFSVLICILNHYRIIESLSGIISFVFASETILTEAIISGILEMTVGLFSVYENTDINTTLIISSFLLGWGGFSVHMQALSCIAEQNLKTTQYFIGKISHALTAGFLTYICTIFF